MPTYDYKCTNCGHVVEVVHGVNEARPTVCPECGGLLRKAMSAPAIHFRGTGWAKKDARQAIAARTGKTETGETGRSSGVAAAGSGSAGTGTGDRGGEKDGSKRGGEGGGKQGGVDGGKGGEQHGGESKAGSPAASSGNE